MDRWLILRNGDVIGTVYAPTAGAARRAFGRIAKLGTRGVVVLPG